MNGLYGRDYFEVVERRHDELLAAKKGHAALQVARLLYAQTPRDSVRHGVAARSIAAGHNALRQHHDAWQWAQEAWCIHSEQLQSSEGALHVLGERAASGAYAGAMGLLLLLGPEGAKDKAQVHMRARVYAHMALKDFETYRKNNDDEPHQLEALSLSRISITESVLGSADEGRRLAHRAFDLVEVAEGRFGGEVRDMDQARLGAFGAMVVATTGDLLRMGENLYDTVREIV